MDDLEFVGKIKVFPAGYTPSTSVKTYAADIYKDLGKYSALLKSKNLDVFGQP